MGKNILSRVGFMTQEDKTEFDKNFEFLLNRMDKLENDVVNLNNGMKRLEEKFDKIIPKITASHSLIDEVSTTIFEIKNNLRIFNQSERQLIKEIESKLFLQLKSQFDEIHYLQYNSQKTQQSAENIEKNILDMNTNLINKLKELLNNLNENQLTKSDLNVVESFLRLIAANQMIQETFLNITEDSNDKYAPI